MSGFSLLAPTLPKQGRKAPIEHPEDLSARSEWRPGQAGTARMLTPLSDAERLGLGGSAQAPEHHRHYRVGGRASSDKFSKKMMGFIDGPPTFYNLDIIEVRE
jgi:hypothetical protein